MHGLSSLGQGRSTYLHSENTFERHCLSVTGSADLPQSKQSYMHHACLADLINASSPQIKAHTASDTFLILVLCANDQLADSTFH